MRIVHGASTVSNCNWNPSASTTLGRGGGCSETRYEELLNVKLRDPAASFAAILTPAEV